MSTTQLIHEHDAGVAATEGLPTSLESSDSKLVYLYVRTAGEATVTDLQSTLDMTGLSLFPVLRTLEGEDLIEREGETVTVAA